MKLSVILMLSLAAANAVGQAPALGPSSKIAVARRVPGLALRIDGKLDDDA